MDTLASLVALIIISLVIVTPSVVFGNYVTKKLRDRKSEKERSL